METFTPVSVKSAARPSPRLELTGNFHTQQTPAFTTGIPEPGKEKAAPAHPSVLTRAPSACCHGDGRTPPTAQALKIGMYQGCFGWRKPDDRNLGAGIGAHAHYSCWVGGAPPPSSVEVCLHCCWATCPSRLRVAKLYIHPLTAQEEAVLTQPSEDSDFKSLT